MAMSAQNPEWAGSELPRCCPGSPSGCGKLERPHPGLVIMLLSELVTWNGSSGLVLLPLPPPPAAAAAAPALSAASGSPVCASHMVFSACGATCCCCWCVAGGCCTSHCPACACCASPATAAAAPAAPAGMTNVAASGGLGPMLSPSPFISRDCRLRISVACSRWEARAPCTCQAAAPVDEAKQCSWAFHCRIAHPCTLRMQHNSVPSTQRAISGHQQVSVFSWGSTAAPQPLLPGNARHSHATPLLACLAQVHPFKARRIGGRGGRQGI